MSVIDDVRAALADYEKAAKSNGTLNLDPDMAEWLRSLLAEVEAREKELVEYEKRVRATFSADRCPKCGAGISFDCYGCKAKSAQEESARLARENEALRNSILELEWIKEDSLGNRSCPFCDRFFPGNHKEGCFYTTLRPGEAE